MSSSTLNTALAPAAAWWRGLAARERQLLTWGGVVVAVALLWWLAVQPAWRLLAQAPAEHERLDAQLQQMQRDAAEAQQLRALPPLPAEEAGTALRAATDRLGNKARLVLQGERATVTFTGVGSNALRDWLSARRESSAPAG